MRCAQLVVTVHDVVVLAGMAGRRRARAVLEDRDEADVVAADAERHEPGVAVETVELRRVVRTDVEGLRCRSCPWSARRCSSRRGIRRTERRRNQVRVVVVGAIALARRDVLVRDRRARRVRVAQRDVVAAEARRGGRRCRGQGKEGDREQEHEKDLRKGNMFPAGPFTNLRAARSARGRGHRSRHICRISCPRRLILRPEQVFDTVVVPWSRSRPCTRSCTAIRTSRSSTAPAIPRSSSRRPRGSAWPRLRCTDHDGFYGVVRFAEAARPLGSADGVRRRADALPVALAAGRDTRPRALAARGELAAPRLHSPLAGSARHTSGRARAGNGRVRAARPGDQ